MDLLNTPDIHLGVVGVSRDCFPVELTAKRLDALMAELEKLGVNAFRCPTIIESEDDAMSALEEMDEQGCDAAVIFLGNFGPEGPTTIFAQCFAGPVMVCAAAEEAKAGMIGDRGDALCGMLNCSYNLGLRDVPAYIPQQPVGLADELAGKIGEFVNIARVIVGLSSLKVFGFGPRPQDFLACNAPIKPFYDLGIEVMENSELDLYQLFRKAGEKTADIAAIAADMQAELGPQCCYVDLLPKLAQFEIALLDFMDDNLGSCAYGVFADKCWPAFQEVFGFCPCYVNSRLAGRGIPVACEVDLYGAVSEYMVQLASNHPATLLDINNSVPADVVPQGADLKGAALADLFMGFHCGNTCSSCMKTCSLKYQLIMNRLLEEEGAEPDITRGTLEGQIKPGPMTMFRLQSTPDCQLRSYIAEGEFLDIDPCSFGSIGIAAVPEFARFYRHILIGKQYPHHGAFGFKKVGKVLFEAVKLLGVTDIGTPLPKHLLYAGENPFELFA